MFWEKFYSLCKSKKEKPLQVVKNLNIASGSITKWKNGSIPHGKNLQKLAAYFGVTVEYLLADDPKEEKPSEDLGELEENTLIFHRNGKTEKKTFSKSNMELLLAMADAIEEKEKDI